MSFRWNLRKTETDSDCDNFIFGYAFQWYQELPDFLKSLGPEYLDTEFERFKEDLEKGYNFAAFDNNKLVAVVNATVLDKRQLEGHLFCGKEANEDIVSSLISFARHECLKTHHLIVCHIVQKHKFLKKVMQRAAFGDTGLRRLEGKRLVPVAIYATSR